MNSDFFKDPVAIATLVLAFVTAFLAIGTFLTIRQNRKFREKDRKERLLNEIIEWAINVSNCSINVGVSESLKAAEGPLTDKILTIAQLDEWGVRLQHLITRGIYAVAISQDFSDEFKNSVNILKENLQIFYTSLFIQRTTMKKEGASAEFIKNKDLSVSLREKMDISTRKVIEEATKLKTENIG